MERAFLVIKTTLVIFYYAIIRVLRHATALTISLVVKIMVKMKIQF